MPTSIVRLKVQCATDAQRTTRDLAGHCGPDVYVNNGMLLPGRAFELMHVDGEWSIFVRKGQSRAARAKAVADALALWHALPLAAKAHVAKLSA